MSDVEIWWAEILAARLGLDFATVDNLLRSGWEYVEMESGKEPPKWIKTTLPRKSAEGEQV